MTDQSTTARELAHEIASRACHYKGDGNHSALCDSITIALRNARNAALEDAAKVADEILVHGIHDEIICGDTTIFLASGIRALKDKDHD